MDPVTLVLRSKRQKRAAAVQKLQHLVPAVILLGDGWSALARHAAGVEFAIALFEVVSGALFVFAAMRGIRGAVRGASRAHPHPHAHRGIDWTDVFAAAVVLAETIEHYHRTGHIVRPNVLMIATLLIMAVSHGRIMGFAERRRALRISDDGIKVGGRPFRRKFHARWNAIRTIAVTERFATIETTDGRSKRIDLQDLENGGDVRSALIGARARLAPGG
jgi:hypothetical protein